MQGNDLAIARRNRTFRGPLAFVIAAVLAGALLIGLGDGGPASAAKASRGFVLQNKSDLPLKVWTVQKVPKFVCVNPGTCAQTFHDIDFEGRPPDGSVLNPGQSQRWELKYFFNIFGGTQYAANLWYKIQGNNDPDDNVYYEIRTYSTSNDSYCNMNKNSNYTCTAEGTDLTFKKK